jgi:hypothetical protein
MRLAAMRILPTSVIAATFLIAALPVMTPRVEAKTGVLRCQMADGTSVYTNKACAAFGAKSVPLPGHVLDHIEREQRHEARLNGIDLADASSTPLRVGMRRSVQGGCAADPRQLAADLTASVAMRDVNRVAESFDWAGMSNAQAHQVMVRLERLSAQMVMDAEYFDATVGEQAVFADAGRASDGLAGQMQVTVSAGNSASVLDFEVRRDEGCYFLQY